MIYTHFSFLYYTIMKKLKSNHSNTILKEFKVNEMLVTD